jgi:hypothetical protein
MLQGAQISTTDEQWIEVSDFPLYVVSDWGRVIRTDNDRLVTATKNTRGIPIVGLMKEGRQFKRALNVLVATAFVTKPDLPTFDAVINLDGNRENNHYSNLAWRPMWFARRYAQQFNDGHDTYDHPIEDVATGITYMNSYSAAVHHGLLDVDILIGMAEQLYVWPTRQYFRKLG